MQIADNIAITAIYRFGIQNPGKDKAERDDKPRVPGGTSCDRNNELLRTSRQTDYRWDIATLQIETSLEENWNLYTEASPHTAPIENAGSIHKAEIFEDGTVLDNVDDAVKFLDTSPWLESVAKPEWIKPKPRRHQVE